MLHADDLVEPSAKQIAFARRLASSVASSPSDAPTESRSAIHENPKNKIASFRSFKSGKLAISKKPNRPKIDSDSMTWVVFHGRLFRKLRCGRTTGHPDGRRKRSTGASPELPQTISISRNLLSVQTPPYS
jgi:hypothetical protein